MLQPRANPGPTRSSQLHLLVRLKSEDAARLSCEMCVGEAVITLLYPYLVQFITLDSFESIKATVHQPKRFGSSALAMTFLNATKGNIRC